ncbi:MAG: FHA domain-containing protein [Aggregatilineales bacterium]
MSTLAKLIWQDPHTSKSTEFVLVEGAIATIGRSANNDIQIPEQHISRQHAVIQYRDGVFLINDLDSSNGTFVNDKPVEEPFPLFAGDNIRLYVQEIRFAAADATDVDRARESHSLIMPTTSNFNCSLTVTNGPQEGQTFPLLLDDVRVGRATTTATWEIMLQDPSISRPHARLKRINGHWHIYDLTSSNGTSVNNVEVDERRGFILNDGDILTLGGAVLLFRAGWVSKPSRPMM